MKPDLMTLLLVVLLAACDDHGSTGSDGDLPCESGITVMTRNIYVGADLDPILNAPLPEIPYLVAEAFSAVRATDFTERAEALADEIAEVKPHLVGLQEVAHIRIQSPGDFSEGNPTTATETVLDYLEILLEAIERRGLDYNVAAVSQGFDVELPSGTGDDLRLAEHDVILARNEVAIDNVAEENFTVNVEVDVGGAVPVTILHGWAAVDATVNGRTIRFVSTRLQLAPYPQLMPVQVAQATELVDVLAQETLPVVLVGDFNSAADGSTTPSHQVLTEAGFVDAWNELHGAKPGYTCCQAADLGNPDSQLTERIDIVFFRDGVDGPGELGGLDVDIVGEDPADRTPSGLWPSDHAGVAATLCWRVPDEIEGFVRLGRNVRGYLEYEHELTGIVFVRIPGGTFDMGSPEEECQRNLDEGPVHQVTLSSFLIAKYEVSQAEWEAVMGYNHSQFAGQNLPVENVSWEEIQEFEALTGLTLPSEAQWEYACRANTRTPFAFGDCISVDQVNFAGDPYCPVTCPGGPFLGMPVPVDSYDPNAFGLYNMHGNVWEWCEDLYDAGFYSRPEAAEPDPVSTSGSGRRVARGGGMDQEATYCRSANRNRARRGGQSFLIGFRPSQPFR